MKKINSSICLALTLSILFSCSDESAETEKQPTNPPSSPELSKPPVVSNDPELEFPLVYVEELDQIQEFFKEQHETSFSHLPNKNWMSYTAGKDGVLTKILLFGRPNYMVSEHYGSAMSGFVRAGNPNTGAKYGSWELSRDDIVNQLSGQGLEERESGWITIRLRGEIPQEAGKTYFLVCDRIADGRPWFGAFAFGDGNPYLPGRHWLHPGHDLVFRTYVGKTAEQIEREQKTMNDESPPVEDKAIATSPILQPPPPKPLGQPAILVESESPDSSSEKTATENPPPFIQSNPEKTENSESIEIIDLSTEGNSTEEKKQKSLFDRLFKNKNE